MSLVKLTCLDAAGQNEGHIKSLVDQKVMLPAPYSRDVEKSVEVHLKKHEFILFYISVKYSVDDVIALEAADALTVAQIWTDPKELFYFTLLKKSSSTEE